MNLVDDARLYFVVEADASDRLLDAALGGHANGGCRPADCLGWFDLFELLCEDAAHPNSSHDFSRYS